MSTQTTTAPRLELRDGNSIPRIGLGTWPLDDDQAADAVETALAVGYRLIDTAARYGNEAGVGLGIARAGVPREEVIVTTKLRGAQHGYEAALAGFEESRARLGLDYVDLFLIHWPLPAAISTSTPGARSSRCASGAWSARSGSPISRRRTSSGWSTRPA